MTDDVQDSRFHEERLRKLWAQAYESADLMTVVTGLYAHEINVGLQTFYDGGVDVWLGDPMNGRRIEESFDRDAMGEIVGWLQRTAEDYYPTLKRGRLDVLQYG